MTSMIYTFSGRDWVLTDEASQSSYGEPCLVSDDGQSLRATEIAIIDEGEPVSAYDLLFRADTVRNRGEDIPSGEYPAFERMLNRYMRQHPDGARLIGDFERRFGVR